MIDDIFISFPNLLLYFLLLITGLCVGSFLNVIIDRLPNGRGLGGRSKADCCGVTLGVADLFPVLTFFLQSGKCRHCGKKISFYYPLVELTSAILTAVTFFYFPFPFNLFYLVNFYFLIIFFFTDLKYGLVPVSVFLAGLCYVSVFEFYLFLSGFLTSDFLLLNWAGALGAALFFVFLILITKGKGMGFGDVLLVFLFSLMVGFPASISMVFLSFILGGFVSSLLLIFKKKHFGQTLPFGPFLSLASGISLIFGKDLVNWYLQIVLK